MLETPIVIGSRRFANRSVLAPMVINCADTDGSVTGPFREFYLARAEQQVGYVLVGATYVHPHGKGFDRQLGIYSDPLMPGLADLAAGLSVHCRVGIQLSFKSVGKPPTQFNLEDIQTYRESFRKAAERARAAGFDAVELHACHEYWLNYFLSPHFNRRSDAYGGSLPNRFRLLREVVDSIRTAVGSDLIVGVRLSLNEFVEDGLRLDETIQIGSWLDEMKVDYISASGGIAITQHHTSPPMDVPRASLLPLAAELKKKVSVPVIGVGRLDRPDVFRRSVSDGYCDLAAVARALIADPGYARKVMAGQDQSIRPCIACNHCLLCLQRNEPVRCAVNPFIGRDRMAIPSLKKPVSVVVVGGGPAGLSAAAHASKRGGRVCLFERSSKLGGALRIGHRAPHKEPIKEFADYLADQAQQAGCRILLGREATADIILMDTPDHVIVATGGTSIIPDINGLETHPRVFTAEDVLYAPQIEPGTYLVIGGGAVGLETAELIRTTGAHVTVLEMTDTLGRGMHATRQLLIVERLRTAGVCIHTETTPLLVDGSRVWAKTSEGPCLLGSFDVVVVAAGCRTKDELSQRLVAHTAVSVIGDAVHPRSIREAVSEGLDAALKLGEVSQKK
ncbi:MAG: FAD-dependent oxidoreductase [Desulfobacterales bacterium]|nr:FAD-dependent oxidoreductase [Desulfobacterales bacterium]